MMGSWSIRKRMTVVAAVIILIAFSLIYFIAKSAYTSASKSRLQESLVAQIYALMAVAEEQEGELIIPEMLRNDRLNHLNSGLVAYVLDTDGDLIWRSKSSDYYSVLPDVSVSYSLSELTEWRLDSDRMFWIGDTIIWEHDNGLEGQYLFLIGEKRTLLTAAVREFKREVLLWLILTAVILLVVLGYAVNAVLRPLRQAQRQIEWIRQGEGDKLQGDFPPELQPLTSSINAFIETEAQQKTRYRDTLGNLAHSLKTPLTVIKTELAQLKSNADTSVLGKQVDRIDDIVKYQLNRSVATAGQTLKRKTPVAPEVEKVVAALNKVHQSRGINISANIEQSAVFPGEQGDLMELVGNLADNACKWAHSKVIITISRLSDEKIKTRESASDITAYLQICVEDDGGGIPSEKRESILDRGKRLDQKAEGQGLGLSIVVEIVKLYKGEISIFDSELGGAKFLISIPLHY